jgi:UDP-2-acetamido-2,6-beta-L-arabino-hexul-4-ose reductase
LENVNLKKISVGITGQPGFMGTHLYNYLGLQEAINRVEFKDDYFPDKDLLCDFVKKCDVIIHLAGMNRHGDAQVIYNTNIDLVKSLINACECTNSKPHIVFSSSTQEELDNYYGKSKKEGRILLEHWAERSGAKFTGLIIPNVFGPFGKPFYNSFISTFSYQLTHGEIPEIHVDSEVKLIYINELVAEIYNIIKDSFLVKEDEKEIRKIVIPYTYSQKVTDILTILMSFREIYFENGIIPDLKNKFNLALFNTFRCSMPDEIYPVKLKKHSDERGFFSEIIKTNSGGQFSFSETEPNITRGNHFHTRKFERFTVIEGNARIQLRKIGGDKVLDYFLNGKDLSYVDIPVWHTHNITNCGDSKLLTLFWINEPYNPDDPDTYFEGV